MYFSTDLSYVFSILSGKKHPGSSPLSRWYFTHSQQIPFLGQPGYEQLQCSLFCSFLHSIFDLRFYLFKNLALPGFEPGSSGPEPEMIGHYTTGLCAAGGNRTHSVGLGSRNHTSRLLPLFIFL